MKKSNKIIILSMIATIFLVVLIIFILNYSRDDSSFSLIEKKWLKDNVNNVIDINVFNDIPVYGESGNGVIFEYLDEFTKEHNVDFNKISYLTSDETKYGDVSFRVLNYNQELTENDILFHEDHYVIVSKDIKVFDNISDIKDISLGVISNEMEDINYYLNGSENVSFKSFDSVEKMVEALTKEQITHMALPLAMNLDVILANNLNVVYHISELNKKYVLNVSDKTLLGIMKKYNNKYMEDFFDETYRNYFLSNFFTSKKITESEKMSYNTSAYTYGYVTNMPFENTVNNEFVGTISNYLSDFEYLSDIEIKLVKYDTINDLKQALSKGEVDFAFNNFNLKGMAIDTITTISPFEEKYVVLSKENMVINSLRSLKDKEAYVVNGTYLYDYAMASGIKAKAYNDTDELLRSVEQNSIILMDESTYNYYKERRLADYEVVFSSSLSDNYTFVVRDVDKNKTLSSLLSYYVSSVDYDEIKLAYNTDYIVKGSNTLSSLIRNVIIGIILVSILVISSLIIMKKLKKKKKKTITKEDKYKFIDIMTSLKNRNYLNYNIKKWDDNVIYPQAIIIIDLNNIKYINDNHGHSEGDKVIKQAANILMMNQVENSDIVRTDGNEFLIYLVGYSEKDVVAYTRKLSKELKELPYNFGATLGYSTIVDDAKTIDDAINEATIAMRAAKH